jgi:hypothetical protein
LAFRRGQSGPADSLHSLIQVGHIEILLHGDSISMFMPIGYADGWDPVKTNAREGWGWFNKN